MPPISSRPALLRHPELDLAVLAFFIHFVWEFLQMPWYAGVPEMSHLEGVKICTQATLGDVIIALVAYSTVSLVWRDRLWPLNAKSRGILLYLVIGLLITVGLEWHATEIADRWQYGPNMWRLPLIGTGLAPTLQWIVLPLLSLLVLRKIWNLSSG